MPRQQPNGLPATLPATQSPASYPMVHQLPYQLLNSPPATLPATQWPASPAKGNQLVSIHSSTNGPSICTLPQAKPASNQASSESSQQHFPILPAHPHSSSTTAGAPSPQPPSPLNPGTSMDPDFRGHAVDGQPQQQEGTSSQFVEGIPGLSDPMGPPPPPHLPEADPSLSIIDSPPDGNWEGTADYEAETTDGRVRPLTPSQGVLNPEPTNDRVWAADSKTETTVNSGRPLTPTHSISGEIPLSPPPSDRGGATEQETRTAEGIAGPVTPRRRQLYPPDGPYSPHSTRIELGIRGLLSPVKSQVNLFGNDDQTQGQANDNALGLRPTTQTQADDNADFRPTTQTLANDGALGDDAEAVPEATAQGITLGDEEQTQDQANDFALRDEAEADAEAQTQGITFRAQGLDQALAKMPSAEDASYGFMHRIAGFFNFPPLEAQSQALPLPLPQSETETQPGTNTHLLPQNLAYRQGDSWEGQEAADAYILNPSSGLASQGGSPSAGSFPPASAHEGRQGIHHHHHLSGGGDSLDAVQLPCPPSGYAPADDFYPMQGGVGPEGVRGSQPPMHHNFGYDQWDNASSVTHTEYQNSPPDRFRGTGRRFSDHGPPETRAFVRTKEARAGLESGDVVMLVHQRNSYVAVQSFIPSAHGSVPLGESGAASQGGSDTHVGVAGSVQYTLELVEGMQAEAEDGHCFLEVVRQKAHEAGVLVVAYDVNWDPQEGQCHMGKALQVCYRGQGPFIGFRSSAAGNRFVQPRRKAPHRLVFFNSHLGVWEQWEVGTPSLAEPWSVVPLLFTSRRLPQVQLQVEPRPGSFSYHSGLCLACLGGRDKCYPIALCGWKHAVSLGSPEQVVVQHVRCAQIRGTRLKRTSMAWWHSWASQTRRVRVLAARMLIRNSEGLIQRAFGSWSGHVLVMQRCRSAALILGSATKRGCVTNSFKAWQAVTEQQLTRNHLAVTRHTHKRLRTLLLSWSCVASDMSLRRSIAVQLAACLPSRRMLTCLTAWRQTASDDKSKRQAVIETLLASTSKGCVWLAWGAWLWYVDEQGASRRRYSRAARHHSSSLMLRVILSWREVLLRSQEGRRMMAAVAKKWQAQQKHEVRHPLSKKWQAQDRQQP
eukprot:gene27178-2418_t